MNEKSKELLTEASIVLQALWGMLYLVSIHYKVDEDKMFKDWIDLVEKDAKKIVDAIAEELHNSEGK